MNIAQWHCKDQKNSVDLPVTSFETLAPRSGPFLPFGHATGVAVAADQSGRPFEAQHFVAMDGRSVPLTVTLSGSNFLAKSTMLVRLQV